MTIGIMVHAPIVTIGTLLLFVLMDVGDGILARWHGEETLRRRMLDSIADRFAVHAVFAAYAVTAMSLPAVWLALVARDGIQTVTGMKAAKQGFIGVGGMSHKLLGLGTAVVGGWFVLRDGVPWQLSAAMVAGLTWCTVTYTVQMNRLLRRENTTGVVQVPAGLAIARGNEGDG
ncbi:phosphatidylglycerophosphate synthase [Nocardia transvalensis]|uniref:Phosphatidylglycerophosphate synthase n=2 Tax=Nocardia transvalensis TaxID=37333 RepID=A0A7W9PMN9_9NOCA|nr:phosphatidylglycerophosphate synthase [Nocardia transvalensis]